MQIKFSEAAWEDYLFWQSGDKVVLKRINSLLKDILRSPFEGIGKPEPLRHRRVSGRAASTMGIDWYTRYGMTLVARCRYRY